MVIKQLDPREDAAENSGLFFFFANKTSLVSCVQQKLHLTKSVKSGITGAVLMPTMSQQIVNLFIEHCTQIHLSNTFCTVKSELISRMPLSHSLSLSV